MAENGIGARLVRKEDQRFLTGKGNYTDDITLTGQTYAAFVRSPHGHAVIQSIDTSAAAAAPGVVAVLTGDDAEADGIAPLPFGASLTGKDGEPNKAPPHPVLAQGKVRYVGDHVAVVIAETLAQAKDAAEKVAVDYDALPAVTSLAKATASGAPQLHDDVPDNVVLDWEFGDKAAVDEAFAGAHHVAKLDLVNNRMVTNPMEPRAANADYNTGTGETTLYVTSQNPHVHRLVMSAFVQVAPEHKFRVVAPDVGGGFGSKIFVYNEEVVCAWAARRVGRPVKWNGDRSEAFLSDAHGRDHLTTVELALDENGKFLGLRVSSKANMGAYLQLFSATIPTLFHAFLLAGQYTTPAIYIEMMSSPDHAAANGLNYAEHLEGIAAGIEEARAECGIEGRIIVTCVRHFGTERGLEIARQVVAQPHPLVVGFGMGGDEAAYPAGDFTEVFDYVAAAGMPCTVHAGEWAGPESVSQAMATLPVGRLGHGVRAIEDPGLVSEIAARGLVLEVCPGSNLATGVFPSPQAHPFNSLRRAGVAVTLNSDDPPYFATSIGHEYDFADRHFGLDESELRAVTRTALEAAFVDDGTKATLLAKVES